MNIKWDANKYTSDFSFVHQYGNDVIDLIAAEKNSTVLRELIVQRHFVKIQMLAVIHW